MHLKNSFITYIAGFISLFIFGSFYEVETSDAATHYVSPSGNASWTQSVNIETPCSAATSMANAQAGDVVYFRGGTYMAPVTSSSGYTPALRPSRSGTAGNLIVFKAYQGEVPFISNANNKGGSVVAAFGVYSRNYIVWDGFHTKAVPNKNNVSKCVVFYNANYCILRNCIIEGLLNGGADNNNALRVEGANYLVVENNKLYNSTGNINATGIMSYKAHNMIVRNNDIYNCDTAIYDKNDGQNNKYYLNHIWNSVRGIHSNVKWVACSGNKFYQNIIRNIGAGWAMNIAHAGEEGGSANGFLYYNNTIYGSANGISTDQPNVKNTEIFNNMCVNTKQPFLVYSGTASYYSNNATSGNFINPGGSNPGDYKRTSYPQNGRGGGYSLVMGAYITGDEIIGYADPADVDSPTSKPDPPRDFR